MLLAFVLLLQIAMPLALLGTLTFRPPLTRSAIVVSALLWVGTIVALVSAGEWTILPWWLPYALAVASVPILWRLRVRLAGASAWPRGGRNILLLALGAIATVACGAIAWIAFDGRRLPEGPTAELAFPLRGGTFAVASSGGNALLDLQTTSAADPRYVAHPEYRVDLVRLNLLGMRASGLAPADPGRYAVFGNPVTAPCAGVVTNAEGSLPDLPVPATDPHNTLGNHVVLDCAGLVVTLAHLRQGSLTVRQGQRIDADGVIAAVGNSGDSREPHLAITAKRRGTALLLGGDALPIRFAGRYLTRNHRFEN